MRAAYVLGFLSWLAQICIYKVSPAEVYNEQKSKEESLSKDLRVCKVENVYQKLRNYKIKCQKWREYAIV